MPLERLFVLRDDANLKALGIFLKANWRALADQGKPLAVAVAEHKGKRNSQQNRLMWAILNQVADEAWIDGKQYSADAWHEFFKRRLIGSEEAPNGGTVGLSTTTLSVHEFADYVSKIQAYAANELGVELI